MKIWIFCRLYLEIGYIFFSQNLQILPFETVVYPLGDLVYETFFGNIPKFHTQGFQPFISAFNAHLFMYADQCFFFREKKNPSHENFLISAREEIFLPVKISRKLPVKNQQSP